MLAVTLLLIAAAAAPVIRPASGGAVASAATTTALACRSDARRFELVADYRVWRSASVRVANSSFSGQCVVYVTLPISFGQWQPGRSSTLLLVKIERLWLSSSADKFFAMSNTTSRTNDFCSSTAPCGTAYLWASEPVSLYLYVRNTARITLASYEASFVVTEATNVCDLVGRSGELLVQSGRSEYAFAPDARHKALSPNNVTCVRDFEYSLTLLPSVASGLFSVTVLACPQSDSCGTLELNGQRCSSHMKAASGSRVTLRYTFRSCDKNQYFAGFVVSAEIDSSAGPPLTSATSRLSARTGTVAARETTPIEAVRDAHSNPIISAGRTSASRDSDNAVDWTKARTTEARSSPIPPSTSGVLMVAGDRPQRAAHQTPRTRAADTASTTPPTRPL